ncbi:MAG: translation initiation factor IF-2 [Peptococcaceae bacterium BICA1-7]|nr:MAG: translation initiation factor IF-2 [Peptococcaceae bacterium BICA1-7]HBV98851.1 translation initiation factor IF-2 [Desulfotomaculum sp.]
MVKKRVHELAKELDIESKDIIKGMTQLGISVKSHMSTLEDGEIERFLNKFHNKGQSPAVTSKENNTPPAAQPAEITSPAAEKQPPKDMTRRETAQEEKDDKKPPVDKRRQDSRRDPRYDRGPGLVDRVPSRPPDRRFDDRAARTPSPPNRPQPSAPPYRQDPVRGHQQSEQARAVPPVRTEGQVPTQAPGPADRADPRFQPRPPQTDQQQGMDRPKYPDRQRPATAQGIQEQRPAPGRDRPAGEVKRDQDNRPVGRPGGDNRGFQQRGPAGGFDRPRPDANRPGAMGDRPRNDGRPDFNRPGQPRPIGDRPGPNRPMGDRPGPNRPMGDRPGPNRPMGDRPGQARPVGDRPARPPGAGMGRSAPGSRPGGGAPALKVPKVPEQAKGVDKIKASEKSRTRLQQTQNKGGFAKGRDKRTETDNDRARNSARRRGQQKPRQEQRPLPPQEKKPVIIGESVTVQELAEKMKKSPAELIKKLMVLGTLATINQEIDADTATILAGDFGFEVEIKIELDAEGRLEVEQEDKPEDLLPRPCVVTVMGHVDHGKTSLLDAIRESNVIATEAGGITQHIGAYQAEHNNKKITFVDTPGHEAFTAMRARGANVTDIVVLVVAADDGVMPQTIEAINHAKAAEVPIIVAVNKMDKPDASPDRVKQQLTEYNLVPEEWGGDTISVPVSAKAREGIDDLLESILLVSEVSEFKANPNRAARGTVIEAELDKGRGPVASVLVQNGTLQIGDNIVAGTAFGKVRAMMDDKGRRIKKAAPSTPVEVLGFHDVPQAGDAFYVVRDDKTMRQIIEKRVVKKRQEDIKTVSRVTLEDLFKNIQEGQIKELNLIVKADVQGSVEAIKQSLERLSTDEVKVNIIHGGVGAIRESDIMFASTSNAIIIGFNVRPDVNARKAAENEKVDIRLYRVIYDAINEVKAAMSGLLEPELKEVVIGRVEVRKMFKASKLGNIAGCYVTEGKISRDAGIRLIRDGIVIYEGKVDSLKRFKDDAKDVAQGYECGLTLDNYQDIREGDMLEAYTTEEIKRELA